MIEIGDTVRWTNLNLLGVVVEIIQEPLECKPVFSVRVVNENHHIVVHLSERRIVKVN